jgi:integrase
VQWQVSERRLGRHVFRQNDHLRTTAHFLRKRPVLNWAGLVFPDSQGEVAHHETVLCSLEPIMAAGGVTKPILDEKGEPQRDAEGRTLVEPKYALHAFRHFFASWCIDPKERGGRELPPKVVQRLLGHGSIVMTLDRYGHLFPRGDDRNELSKAVGVLLA